MPTRRVLVSFEVEDEGAAKGLLAKNPNYDLELYGESVRVSINSEQVPYI